MHLHQLKYFVAIVESGSMTKAALQCHTSQPSISQQIGKLEGSLNAKLFERIGHKVELTESGSILYAQAKKILETIEVTKNKIESQNMKAGQMLKIGAIPTISSFVLPKILFSLNSQYPSISLHVREEISEKLCAACVQGDVDVVLTVAPISHNELDSFKIIDDQLYLVVVKDHALAKLKEISLQQLEDESFILMEDIHCLSKHVEQLCFSKNFVPRVRFHVSQVETVRQLVELGYGVSILPGISKSHSSSTKIAYIPISDVDASRELTIVTRRGSALNNPAQEFIRLVKTCI